jgi:hypothetical protein
MSSGCGRSDCVCTLPTSGAFLLWAMRQWRSEACEWERQRALPAQGSLLRRGFEAAGIRNALTDFALAMDALLTPDGRPIAINPPSCARLSHDEACLLSLFSLAQSELDRPLIASLNLMMDPIRSIGAAISLRAFGAAFADAGLHLPAPVREAGVGLH